MHVFVEEIRGLLFLYVLVLCAIDATVGTGSGLGLGATGGVCLVAPDVDAMLKKTGPTRAHVLDATLGIGLGMLQRENFCMSM
jgi:hypothetical protein